MLDLSQKRTSLKHSEAKELINELKERLNIVHTSKPVVELAETPEGQVIYIDKVATALKRKDGSVIPVLSNAEACARLPKVVVDMGAVPHIVNGADVMAPGIRKVDGQFSAESLLVVTDEKHGKFLAIGKSLMDAESLKVTRQGKTVKNLHYVGDPVWNLIRAD